jgi:hypothetical protein
MRASSTYRGARRNAYRAAKVFEVLSKFGAKNASTVPPEKRAEVIAAVEAELKEKAE